MPRILSAKVLIFVFLLHIIDLSLTSLLRVGPVRPVFLYLAIVYASFQWGGRKTLALSAVAGGLRDITGVHPVGVETVVLVVSALLLDFWVHKIERQSLLVRTVSAFLYIALALFLILTVSTLLGEPVGLSTYLAASILLTALYTACWTPVFFYLAMRWFHDKVPMKQYELFH